MDIKVNAVMLRAVDYGENDKILTLLSAEQGKITAGIKGVKKPNAKLKFAAQPFCFAEYVLAKRGDKFTVINCSECESFYDLRTDINKFYAASAAAEAVSAVTYEGGDCAEIFYAFIRALSEMCAGSERLPLINFLLFVLGKSGYAISLDNCAECGAELAGEEKLRFDMDAGAFTCFDCGTGAGASRVTYNVLRKIAGKAFEEDFITDDGEKRALRLLKEYFTYKTDNLLKSLSEYIRLI
ncbi:MAG: DNA repair protein RecO [Clostridia bacterium]|nr:DNA repair protein RecO [Clostridia bacterium]